MTSQRTGRVKPPSLDTVFQALADRHRRRLMFTLLESPQGIDTAQIPSTVQTGGEDLQTLQIQMVHTHLPKLEETGFIEWDQRANVVRTGPQFEKAQPLLELISEHADELPDDWV